MLAIDNVTIILGSVVLALSVISPLVNVLLVRLKTDNLDEAETSDVTDEEDEGNQTDSCLPAKDSGKHLPVSGISIIVTVDDEADDLKDNLPIWLNQNYPVAYQLIVVMCSNDENVDRVLNCYKDNPRLYTTFIPSSSRYMSRRKLAITVGVKAAKYDWVLLTDVDCYPNSEDWLSAMSENCTQGTDLVLGWSSFEEDYKSSRRFDHVYKLYRQLAFAQRNYAYAYNGCNLMFRKSMFISGKGFDGNLKFIRGEYDFIVNKFSNETNTAIELRDKAAVIERDLTDKGWRNKNLYYLATRKNIDGTLRHRFFFNVSMALMIATNIVDLASLALAIVMQNWILTAVAVFAFVLVFILRGIILAKTIGRFTESMPVIKLVLFEQTMPLRNLFRLFRYKSTDKFDFICHKI